MLNKVILMGRLTADPEIRMSQSGKEVMSFTIAVDRNYTKPGEQRKADFITCVAWRETAKFIHTHFNKGKLINVCGSLQVRTWDDTQGNKRYSTEVVVDEVNFCGDNRNNGTQNDPLNDVVNTMGGTQYPPQGFTPVEDLDSDLPF